MCQRLHLSPLLRPRLLVLQAPLRPSRAPSQHPKARPLSCRLVCLLPLRLPLPLLSSPHLRGRRSMMLFLRRHQQLQLFLPPQQRGRRPRPRMAAASPLRALLRPFPPSSIPPSGSISSSLQHLQQLSRLLRLAPMRRKRSEGERKRKKRPKSCWKPLRHAERWLAASQPCAALFFSCRSLLFMIIHI